MGLWGRLRGLLGRLFAPPPPRPAPPAPRQRRERRAEARAEEPSPREPAGRGRRRRPPPAQEILQLGRPTREAPALRPAQWEALFAAALRVWPDQRYVVVAVFARWRIEDPGDGERYPRAVRDVYGHRVPIVRGRRYWGWRGMTMHRRQLEEFPRLLVPDILQSFDGIRPVHCVTVRPVEL